METTKNKGPMVGLGILLVLVVTGLFLYFTGMADGLIPGSSKSPLDVPDKENPKMVALFNRQLDYHLGQYDTVQCPGCIAAAQQRVAAFYQSLKTIESHTRYGMQSSRAHNAIEVKLTFNDGTVADELYTGISWNGSPMLGAPLVLKADMAQGKVTRVWTNGVELKGSPDWVIGDLNTLIQSAIHYDMNKHHNSYFPPEKTSADFKKEWQQQ